MNTLINLLSPRTRRIVDRHAAGLTLLDGPTRPQLLARVGQTFSEIPSFTPIDKSVLQDSYGGNQKGPSDDFLVGRGLFYVTEQRRLFLDCTSGHYQMLWGYNHPELCEAVEAASRAGVIWDNHSNIPQAPAQADLAIAWWRSAMRRARRIRSTRFCSASAPVRWRAPPP